MRQLPFTPTDRRRSDVTTRLRVAQICLLCFSLLSPNFCLAQPDTAAPAGTLTFITDPNDPGKSYATAYVGVTYNYWMRAVSSKGGNIAYYFWSRPSDMTMDPVVNVDGLPNGLISWRPESELVRAVEIGAECDGCPEDVLHAWTIKVVRAEEPPECTGDEEWTSPDRGLPGPAIAAAVMDGSLYVFHRDRPGWGTGFSLSKWNGLYWTTVNKTTADIPTSSLDRVKMIAYKGALYLSTFLTGELPGSVTSGLAKWDGTSWSDAGAPHFSQIFDMTVNDDMLYVTGWSNGADVLAKWDGAAWQILHEEANITAITSFNGRVYIAGGVDKSQWDRLSLHELVDGQVREVANIPLKHPYFEVLKILPHNNSLIIVMSNSLLQWDGTTSREIKLPPFSFYRQDLKVDFDAVYYRTAFTSYRGDLYFATWLRNEVDTNLLEHRLWRLADTGWRPVSSMKGRIAGAWFDNFDFVEYDGELYGYGSMNQSCGTSLSHIARLDHEVENAGVSGWVYHDDNKNCVPEPNEKGLRRELVEVLPGPFYATTGHDGAFAMTLAPGEYSFNVHPRRNWMNTCQSSSTLTIESISDTNDNLALGIDLIRPSHDVRSSLMVGRLRPGFNAEYTLLCRNNGTGPATGKVIFEYDDRLSYVSSTITPTDVTSNRLEWSFTNVPADESAYITITLNVPASMALETRLCAFTEVELDRKDQEEFLSDNLDTICADVLGSYDPNDIQVEPIRIDPEFQNAPLLPGDTVLTYFVRFQNTGTDTAFTVVVADTLDASLLDITSIQLGAASHEYDFDISGSGILTWTFNNILLPDSNVNELASHGYFKYTIHLRRGLAPMTEIPNRAAIYFDYNAPVITNTVVSITSGTLSVINDEERSASLAISPNPVQGMSSIKLNLSEREHVSLRLIDSRGDIVAIIADKQMNAGEHALSFDTGGLTSGAYYLVLDRSGKKEIYPIVVSR